MKTCGNCYFWAADKCRTFKSLIAPACEKYERTPDRDAEPYLVNERVARDHAADDERRMRR